MDITPNDIQRWLPAAIGIVGGAVTLIAGYLKDRNKEKRYVTRDTITQLDATVNAQAQQILLLQESDKRCKDTLQELRNRYEELKQENYVLRHEVMSLQEKDRK